MASLSRTHSSRQAADHGLPLFQKSVTSRDGSRVTEDGHLPGVKDSWCAAGWARTGLEHHQAVIHLSQKLGVYTFSNVGDLVWICSYIIDFYEHLEAEEDGGKEKSRGYAEKILLRQLFLNGKGRHRRETKAHSSRGLSKASHTVCVGVHLHCT